MILQVIDGLVANGDDNAAVEAEVRGQAEALLGRFPIY